MSPEIDFRLAKRNDPRRTQELIRLALTVADEQAAFHPKMTDIFPQCIAENGYAIVRNAVPENVLRHLDEAIEGRRANTRNLLSVPAVRELASSSPIRELVEPILGENTFAVRAILFNKLPGANWKVAWHQDCIIAVRGRKDIPGWGPWSVKAGIVHVRPPADVLSRMLAVRVHLDDCGEQNGPLRVIPKSHSTGLVTDDRIVAWPKQRAVTCTAKRGDVILMRPLLLHASSQALEPKKRRVVHIEFAADDLTDGIEWKERV